MVYKYYAIEEITLGGKVFKAGKELPNGYYYQDLYDCGMASRKEVKNEDKEIHTTPSLIEIKVKSKRYGKRKNKSNR